MNILRRSAIMGVTLAVALAAGSVGALAKGNKSGKHHKHHKHGKHQTSRNAVVGKVTTVAGNSITIKTKQGERVLTVNNSTTYEKQTNSGGKKHARGQGKKHGKKHGKQNANVAAALTDVQAGIRIAVTTSGDTATKVVLLADKHHGKHDAHGKRHHHKKK